jgi:hypothetical protein
MLTWLKRSHPALRAGAWVEVRSKEEILATLDQDGKYERLPFMPEMLQFCGCRFRVAAVAHKTCDPAHKTGGRRMKDAVHLDGLRCDGSFHGGCQASCLLFWKTAWLKPVDRGPSGAPPERNQGITEEQLLASTRLSTPASPKTIYSCQATCLFEATTPLKWWNPVPYLRDLTSGNVTAKHAAKVLVLAAMRAALRSGVAYRLLWALYDRMHVWLMGRPAPRSGGAIPRGQPTPLIELHLQPGEVVRVRPNEAILATLNVDSKNRGLWFDEEMAAFCGGSYRVQARIERIINEVTGEMMEMKSPCITLEGVSCQALYSSHRLFCPRAIKPYWRESWLDRVDSAAAPPSPSTTLRSSDV